MSGKIIYVLCYDDHSEKMAYEEFGNYTWARIYRIPEHSQNHLFEGVMYQTELMKLYPEWKDKEFVGTISYKLKVRLAYYPQTMADMDNKISTASNKYYQVVPFMYFHGENFEELCADVKHTYKYMTSTLFSGNNRSPISIPKRSASYTETTSSMFFFFNYWMATPEMMLMFISFYNSTWIPMLESIPNVWNNSGYPGHLTPEQLETLTKRVNHYPYHPFINERLPASYFRFKNANIYYG